LVTKEKTSSYFHCMKKTLLLALLAVGLQANAQQDSSKALPGKTIFFWEPAAILDNLSSPSIRLGVQFPINKELALALTGGMYIPKGFISKVELKCYFREDKNKNGMPYGSVEIFYKSQSYQAKDNQKVYDSALRRSIAGADYSYPVDKKVYGLTFKFGQSKTFNRYFVFEWYTGLGIRWKSTDVGISKEEQDKLYHWEESVINALTNERGKKLGLTIALGIRLGVLL
jgi:hypothetical protein